MDTVLSACPRCNQKLQIPAGALGRQVRCPCGNVFVAQTDGAKAPAASPPQTAPAPAGAGALGNLMLSCPHCKKSMGVPATARGRQVKCPHCAGVFAVPAGPAPASAAIKPAAPAPPPTARPAARPPAATPIKPAPARPQPPARPAPPAAKAVRPGPPPSPWQDIDVDLIEAPTRAAAPRGRTAPRTQPGKKGLDKVGLVVAGVAVLYLGALGLVAAGVFDGKSEAPEALGVGMPRDAVKVPGKDPFGPAGPKVLPVDGQDPLDLPYFATNFTAGLVLRPGKVLAAPGVADMPQKDMMLGAAAQELGVDPRKVEQAIILIEAFPGGSVAFFPAGIIRFTEAMDGKQVLTRAFKEFKEESYQGKSYFKTTRPVMAGVPVAGYVVDGRTLLVAPEPTLRKMLTAGSAENPLRKRLRGLDKDSALAGAVLVTPYRKQLAEAINKAGEPALPGLKKLPDQLQAVTADLRLSGDTLLRLTLDTDSAASAKDVANLVRSGLALLQQAYPDLRKQAEARLPHGLRRTALAVLDDLSRGITTGEEGTRAVVRVKMPADLPRLLRKLPELAAGAPPGPPPPDQKVKPGPGSPKTPPAASRDEARAVAEVKKLGGRVDTDFNNPNRVVGVDFSFRNDVTDQTLKVLEKLPTLERVTLSYTKVTPPALAYLTGLKDLKYVALNGVPMADADLARLAKLTGLEGFSIDTKDLTDAGLAHLAALTHLKRLSLGGSKVTDAGLKSLEGLKELQALDVSRTSVKGPGLEALRALSKLTSLTLDGTKVDDAGLAPVANLAGLTELRLDYTAVTDKGLKQVAGLKKLRTLSLNGTAVIGTGVEGLTSLMTLNAEGSKFNDDGLKAVAGLTNLWTLTLGSTQVTDDGLKPLGGLTNLSTLNLNQTKVTGKGLAVVKGLKNLTTVSLSGAAVTDAGLAFVKDLSGTTVFLNLDGTKVTDAGLAHFKGVTSVGSLYLNDTAITDAGLPNLEGLTKAYSISLYRTKVTAAGVARLKKALPRCTINWAPPMK